MTDVFKRDTPGCRCCFHAGVLIIPARAGFVTPLYKSDDSPRPYLRFPVFPETDVILLDEVPTLDQAVGDRSIGWEVETQYGLVQKADGSVVRVNWETQQVVDELWPSTSDAAATLDDDPTTEENTGLLWVTYYRTWGVGLALAWITDPNEVGDISILTYDAAGGVIQGPLSVFWLDQWGRWVFGTYTCDSDGNVYGVALADPLGTPHWAVIKNEDFNGTTELFDFTEDWEDILPLSIHGVGDRLYMQIAEITGATSFDAPFYEVSFGGTKTLKWADTATQLDSTLLTDADIGDGSQAPAVLGWMNYSDWNPRHGRFQGRILRVAADVGASYEGEDIGYYGLNLDAPPFDMLHDVADDTIGEITVGINLITSRQGRIVMFGYQNAS